MDPFVVSVKATDRQPQEAAHTGGKDATLDALVVSFAEMLRNTSARLDDMAATLSTQIDRARQADRPEPAAPADDRPLARRDAGDEAAQPRRARERERVSEEDAPRRDDAPAPRRAENRPEETPRAETTRKAETETPAETPAETPEANAETPEPANATGNPAPQSDATTASDTTSPAGETATAAEALTAAAQQQAAANPAATSAPAEIVAAAAKPAAPQGHGDTAAGRAVEAAPQATANANLGNSGLTLTPRAMPQAAGTQTPGIPSAEAAAQAAPQAEQASGTAQQATQLSRMLGQGNRVSVHAEVANQGNTTVSQPGASLVASAAVQAQTTAQTAAKTGTGQTPQGALHPGAGQAGAETMAATVQPQGQTPGGEAPRAQAAANLAAGAKAPVVASTATGNAGGGAQGQPSGEFLGGHGAQGTAPGETSPHNATQQTTQAHRFMLPRGAMIDQVSVQITKALEAGMDRITIQLRPESLGRVEVRLEVGHDGRLQAMVTADNKDTLEMLQRDARDLARALQDAGFQTDSDSLNFNLRGQQENGRDDDAKGVAGRNGDDSAAGAEAAPEPEPTVTPGGITADGRVDIRA